MENTGIEVLLSGSRLGAPHQEFLWQIRGGRMFGKTHGEAGPQSVVSSHPLIQPFFSAWPHREGGATGSFTSLSLPSAPTCTLGLGLGGE